MLPTKTKENYQVDWTDVKIKMFSLDAFIVICNSLFQILLEYVYTCIIL